MFELVLKASPNKAKVQARIAGAALPLQIRQEPKLVRRGATESVVTDENP